MSLLKKLDNPFLLAAQGFVLGAILFVSAHPDTLHALTRQSVASTPAAADTQP